MSAAQEHFWLGVQISPEHTSHHFGDEWDGTFFGFWNGAEYAPTPVYPPRAVDTHGFDRPPEPDTLQDVFGILRYSGSVAPYNFTAEWRRSLNSQDGDDIVYEADGVTTYNFFVTTDSDGGGSQGGGISHRQMTNLNSFRLEATGSTDLPPTIVHTPPLEIVAGEATTLSSRVVDLEGVAEVRVNYTDVHGLGANESMTLEGSLYIYTLPAQNASGTLSYLLWALDTTGNDATTGVYEISVVKLLHTPTITEVVPDGSECLLVRWDEVPDPSLTGYRLYRWNTSLSMMIGIATLSADDREYLDCNLLPDTTYTYWLVAFDAEDNESPPSVLGSGRTLGRSEPNPPPLAVEVSIIAAPLIAIIVGVVLLRRRST